LQAVAAQVNVGVLLIIASTYISRSHQLNEQLLHNITEQLSSPVMVPGEVIGYNPLWGCGIADSRGKILKILIRNNNYLNIINIGNPTRTSNVSSSTIDLTIVSPSLQPQIE